jgi:hypothetical protein
MPTNFRNAVSERESAEWHFLQSLCVVTLPPSLRLQYCDQARAHVFAGVAHRTIFEELCAMSKPDHPHSTRQLRDDLPARATRRGFPDLDFASLLSTDGLTEQAASDRVARAWQNLSRLQ